jgi:DNA-binding NarL/FixJ family response regulator
MSAAPLRVIVADDSALLRSGIGRLLEDSGLDVLAEAASADELVDLVDTTQPDVVVVDIRMPPTFTLEGVHAAEQIRAAHPGVGLLLLSQYLETRAALGLLRQHGRGIGYLLKDRVGDIADFIEAVTTIAAGGTAIDPEIVHILLDRPRQGDLMTSLTAREHDVLAEMAQGRSNRAIGERLMLATRTVESHVASIFTKFGLEPQNDDNRRVLAVLTYLKRP